MKFREYLEEGKWKWSPSDLKLIKKAAKEMDMDWVSLASKPEVAKKWVKKFFKKDVEFSGK